MSLFVADTGEADLPVVLCLHSLFLDHTMFDDLAAALSGRFRVVRPDFRGQGTSPDASDLVSMDDCAADTIELIEGLGVGPVHVVAQSMGGDVAVRVAARRPDLVDRLVLLGTSAREEPAEHLEAFRPIADEVERTGFVGEILETAMRIMFGESIRSDPSRADILTHWRERIAALPPGLAHAIRGVVERPTAVPLLADVAAPTLVVSGGEDVARPPAWSDEMVALIPDTELWRLPDAGHSLMLEQPDAVCARVLEFLARSSHEDLDPR